MDKFSLLTQHSPWFIILCILTGLGYAFLLYTKKHPWDKRTNRILFTLRFVLVTLLCLLLLGPLIRYIKNNIEKPAVVIALDNSGSISSEIDSTNLKKLKQQLNDLSESLEKEDIKTEFQLLNKSIQKKEVEDVKFNLPVSNISQQLQRIQSDFENRNLTSVVLVTDGIFNQGLPPTHHQFRYNIFPVALGDTVQKKDINIKRIYYNKLSYQGNKFPIVAEIHNKGFKGEVVTVYVKKNGKTLDQRTIKFERESDYTEVEFYQSSDEKGLQHYVIEVTGLKGEHTFANNYAHAFIDIVEGKEKILIVATSPHPDIKAIKSALDVRDNYEITTYIPGVNEYKEDKYDLVIFHQVPDHFNSSKNLLDKFIADKTSLFFIIGKQTNLQQFNMINGVAGGIFRNGQYDNVTPVWNTDFNRFSVEKEDIELINKFPPVQVPFADFTLKNATAILTQKIGSVQSTKPLLVIGNSTDKKIAAFLGDGMWEWRLHEYRETESAKAFDKLIQNLVQYLSSKEDKRKFRVYPVNNEFLSYEPVVFEAEVYNDIFEKIYGQKIDLKIKDEKGITINYSFVNNQGASRFEIKGLKEGIYKYTASAVINGKVETSSGEFSIRELQLESLNTTADHDMLRNLAQSTGGKLYYPSELEALKKYLIAHKGSGIIHSSEELSEIINLPWIFFLLLGLASAEWYLRKYKGGY